jgi:hypothetical protein
MARNAEVVVVPLSRSNDCHYLNCNGDCDECSAARRQQGITAACDGLTASVRDRRENGGTQRTIRTKAFELIRSVVSDLEN